MLIRPALVPLAAALVAAASSAQTTHDVPGAYPTIQAALDAAAPGDTVLVQPGTYNERIDYRGKDVAVRSAGSAADTILDGAGAAGAWTSGSNAVVRFDEGEGPGAQLSGFTVTGSDGLYTSLAVLALGATPTLTDCVLEHNVSTLGGGFTGGGLLVDCIIRDNEGGAGGGTYGDADLIGCVIERNVSHFNQGGGVFATGPCAVTDCVVRDNETGFDAYSGGGIAGPVAISWTLVVGNRIRLFGGVTVNGAGVHEAASIDHATIVDNLIEGQCGTFCDAGGVFGGGPITNSIVRGNSAAQVVGAASVSWSNVQGGAPGVGNFNADPLFVDAAAGDYTILKLSPCKDAGDPSFPLDADASVTDVGAFTKLGALFSEVFAVSVSAGGTQPIHIDAGLACANNVYVLAGSYTGTSPGVTLLNGLHVPLNFDAYFSLTLMGGPASPLIASVGWMDAEGKAEASFVVPPGTDPALVGLHLDHAGVGLGDTLEPEVASNPLPVDLIP